MTVRNRSPWITFFSLGMILILTLWLSACGETGKPTTDMRATAPTDSSTVTGTPNSKEQTTIARAIRKQTRDTDATRQAPTVAALATQEAATMQAESVSAAATRKAYDTAVPFPTVGALTITTGETITATVEQGGVALQVVLPKTTFWASEFVDAQIRLENNTAEPLAFSSDPKPFGVSIVDERGHRVVDSPWYALTNHGSALFPPIQLAPGQVFTATQEFQVPTEFQVHTHAFWTSIDLDRQQGSSVHLEVGPIPLHIEQADPAHELRAHLQVEPAGYRIQVTDGLSRTLAVPVTSFFNVKSSSGEYQYYTGLDARQIAGKWSEEKKKGDIVRLWVWAKDYATALAKVNIPGETTSPSGLIPSRALQTEPIANLQEAQARLGLKMYQPAALPPNHKLRAVYLWTEQVNADTDFSVSAEYLVADDAVIEFTQSGTLQNGILHIDGAYEPSPDAVRFGDQFGFLSERFARWSLRWEQDNQRFKLTAPQAALTQDELLGIAAQIKPLP